VIAGRKNSAGLLHTPTQIGHTQVLSLGGKYKFYILFLNLYIILLILCIGVFASCHSVDPINEILGEESRNREVPDRQLTSVELANMQKNEDIISGNQIVIRVTDADGDTKGNIKYFDKLLIY